jgi:hypothetical protein
MIGLGLVSQLVVIFSLFIVTQLSYSLVVVPAVLTLASNKCSRHNSHTTGRQTAPAPAPTVLVAPSPAVQVERATTDRIAGKMHVVEKLTLVEPITY